MGLFHASKKRSIVSWSLTVSVLALVQVCAVTLLLLCTCMRVTHYSMLFLDVRVGTLYAQLRMLVIMHTSMLLLLPH
jgi:hypothetical protein